MSKYLLALVLSFALTACGSSPKSGGLRVAATPVPHAEMLEEIRDDLKKEGYDLDIVVVDDYNIPNRYVNDGEVSANFFQHKPFLDEQIAAFGFKLVDYGKIHIEPMGVYSKLFKSLNELPTKGTIAIPNDPANEARALLLLEKAGVITLDPKVGLKATTANITSNPKQIRFLEIDAPMLPRTLSEVSAAVIPSNFALQASLNPETQALIQEDPNSPYANILVIRAGDEDRADLKALKKALTSEKMRTFILTKYKGALVPAF